MVTLSVLRNYLSNYICFPGTAAGMTGVALYATDFRLFLSVGNDFYISLLSPLAHGLAITLNHGYVGFSEVKEGSSAAASETTKADVFT